MVKDEVATYGSLIYPFEIQSVKETETTVELTSIPFPTEFDLYSPIGAEATLIWTDYSFTKTTVDLNDYGEYLHADERDEDGNPLPKWLRIDTDVDPWMDQIFTSGGDLVPAVMYACSCPAHSHAQLRVPQATEDEGTRKVNRQRRYPLPSAQSPDRFEEGAYPRVSGDLQSWSTRQFKMSYHQCKHSIAARFIDRIKTKEPDSYPSIETRVKFEEKLKQEVAEVGLEFEESYRRGGITLLELVFAMATALNMDDSELTDVLLRTQY